MRTDTAEDIFIFAIVLDRCFDETQTCF